MLDNINSQHSGRNFNFPYKLCTSLQIWKSGGVRPMTGLSSEKSAGGGESRATLGNWNSLQFRYYQSDHLDIEKKLRIVMSVFFNFDLSQFDL